MVGGGTVQFYTEHSCWDGVGIWDTALIRLWALLLNRSQFRSRTARIDHLQWLTVYCDSHFWLLIGLNHAYGIISTFWLNLRPATQREFHTLYSSLGQRLMAAGGPGDRVCCCYFAKWSGWFLKIHVYTPLPGWLQAWSVKLLERRITS